MPGLAMIAGSLMGVVTQALIPTLNGEGRCAALEIMIPDDAIRNLIRQAKVEQIYTYMQTGNRAGMQTIYNGVQLAVEQLNAQRNGASPSSLQPSSSSGAFQESGGVPYVRSLGFSLNASF